jgi:hypothetical protein
MRPNLCARSAKWHSFNAIMAQFLYINLDGRGKKAKLRARAFCALLMCQKSSSARTSHNGIAEEETKLAHLALLALARFSHDFST